MKNKKNRRNENPEKKLPPKENDRLREIQEENILMDDLGQVIIGKREKKPIDLKGE